MFTRDICYRVREHEHLLHWQPYARVMSTWVGHVFSIPYLPLSLISSVPVFDFFCAFFTPRTTECIFKKVIAYSMGSIVYCNRQYIPYCTQYTFPQCISFVQGVNIFRVLCSSVRHSLFLFPFSSANVAFFIVGTSMKWTISSSDPFEIIQSSAAVNQPINLPMKQPMNQPTNQPTENPSIESLPYSAKVRHLTRTTSQANSTICFGRRPFNISSPFHATCTIALVPPVVYYGYQLCQRTFYAGARTSVDFMSIPTGARFTLVIPVWKM